MVVPLLTRHDAPKRLAQEADDSLKSTWYFWLQSMRSLPRRLLQQLRALLESPLAVGKVRANKEEASKLRSYISAPGREKARVALGKAATRVNSPALNNAIVRGVTNADSESFNSRVQALKKRTYGDRNRARFRSAITFHLADR